MEQFVVGLPYCSPDLDQHVSQTLANTAGTRRIETSIANRYLKHTKTTWQADTGGVNNISTRYN